MLKITRWLAVAIVSFAVVGCAAATAGNGGAGDGDGIPITVINDRIPPSSATVYIIPETGGRQRLGTVEGGARQTFNYTPIVASGEYYLVAEMLGSGDVRSNPFNFLGNVSRLEWSTDQNQVRLR